MSKFVRSVFLILKQNPFLTFIWLNFYFEMFGTLSKWGQLKPFLLPNCIGFFLFLGQLIGDCVDDQFSISGGLSGGTPTICGTNTGYHSKSETILSTSPSTVATYNELLCLKNSRAQISIAECLTYNPTILKILVWKITTIFLTESFHILLPPL